MAGVIPNLFKGFVDGAERARKANWDDLAQYEQVEAARTANDANNLALLGNLEDYYGQRQLAVNNVTRDDNKTIIDIAQTPTALNNAGQSEIISGAKLQATKNVQPRLVPVFSNTAESNLDAMDYNSDASRGVTAVDAELLPQALGANKREKEANIEGSLFSSDNLVGNMERQQTSDDLIAAANNAAARTSAAQSESDLSFIPTANQVRTSNAEIALGSNQDAQNLRPLVQQQKTANLELGIAESLAAKGNVATLDLLSDLQVANQIEEAEQTPEITRARRIGNSTKSIANYASEIANMQNLIASRIAAGGDPNSTENQAMAATIDMVRQAALVEVAKLRARGVDTSAVETNMGLDPRSVAVLAQTLGSAQ